MAYNHGREDRKWRIWKEAEEKLLRECGVDEAGRMTLRNILRTWQAGSGRRKWVRLRSYWKRLRAKISIKY